MIKQQRRPNLHVRRPTSAQWFEFTHHIGKKSGEHATHSMFNPENAMKKSKSIHF